MYKNINYLTQLAAVLLLNGILLIPLLNGAEDSGEKIKIEKIDDLPRFTYEIPATASELIQSEDAVKVLRDAVKKDIMGLLDRYDIEDVPTLRDYYGTLSSFDLLEGRYDDALEKILLIRSMQDKPAEKLTSGLLSESIIKIQMGGEKIGSERTLSLLHEEYKSRIEALPWDVVQDNIKGAKGSWEIWSENLFLGILQSQIDPAIEKSGAVSADMARQILRIHFLIHVLLPHKETVVGILQDYIDANHVEKQDIWAEREVDLKGVDGLEPVIIAIWDSGVDTPIFEKTGQLYVNTKEKKDGTDTDGNGFIDDIHGIAYDLDSKKTEEILFPLPEDMKAKYPEMKAMMKGLLDLQAAIESEEAKALKEQLSSMQPSDVKPFFEELGLFGNYAHGTHVAGIAAAGNPAARILASRITFDHKVIPEPPTLELAFRYVRSTVETVEYFKKSGVRIVNMSWGGDQSGIESDYEANGIGDDSDMRAEMARVIFKLGYDALLGAMADAPEILFIPAAGNSDSNVEFNETIPSSISLSNVLVAGAVDQAGEETDFTSFGENVRIHANGFEVDSYIPGGDRMKFSGTSMAAPNVTNLAGKILALEPGLTPEDVIALIRLGADRSEDGRRILLNPKKTLALLKMRQMESY